MIEAIDLTVRRRGRTVLDAVSFDVRPGQVTGVLGAPGSGKSVLLRRMVQLERGRGRTLFDGRTYRALRRPMREVGVLLDPTAGHPEHSVRAHLRLALACDRRVAREPAPGAAQGPAAGADRPEGPLSARGVSGRIEAVLDVVGLADQARTRLGELTEGMTARLGLAVALVGDPAALLLDCPDRGLGPEGLAWLGALLRAFTGQGRVALVTGSDTETLAALTDRLLLLDEGRLVGSRTAQEARRGTNGSAVIVRSPQILRFAALLADEGAAVTERAGACLEVLGLDRARVGDLAFRHSVPVHELTQSAAAHDPADAILVGCSGRSGRVRLLTPSEAPTATLVRQRAQMPRAAAMEADGEHAGSVRLLTRPVSSAAASMGAGSPPDADWSSTAAAAAAGSAASANVPGSDAPTSVLSAADLAAVGLAATGSAGVRADQAASTKIEGASDSATSGACRPKAGSADNGDAQVGVIQIGSVQREAARAAALQAGAIPSGPAERGPGGFGAVEPGPFETARTGTEGDRADHAEGPGSAASKGGGEVRLGSALGESGSVQGETAQAAAVQAVVIQDSAAERGPGGLAAVEPGPSETASAETVEDRADQADGPGSAVSKGDGVHDRESSEEAL